MPCAHSWTCSTASSSTTSPASTTNHHSTERFRARHHQTIRPP
jgi:hypothetical protein